MRRPRPLGLTIALLACTLLYGLYPLALAVFYLVFALRRQSSGADLRALMQLILSVGLLALVIPAWRGRPPQIRRILTLAVLGLMVLNLAFAAADLSVQPAGVMADSTSDARRVVDLCAFPVYLLVSLYIAWYLNRYPARAFYGE